MEIILEDGTVYQPTEEEPKAIAIEKWYDRHRREYVLYPVDEDGNQMAEAVYAFSKDEAKTMKQELEEEYLEK